MSVRPPAGRIAGAWSRLTARERMLVLVLGLVFISMASIVLFVLRSTRLDHRRDEITEIKQALDQLHTKGMVYRERLKRKQQRESTIATEPLLFSTLLEEASMLSEVQIPRQEEMPSTDLGVGLYRRSIEFELRNVTLDQLLKFLTAVESKPGHIIFTQKLELRSPSPTEDRLNVELEVATWERGNLAPEPSAEGGSP